MGFPIPLDPLFAVMAMFHTLNDHLIPYLTARACHVFCCCWGVGWEEGRGGAVVREGAVISRGCVLGPDTVVGKGVHLAEFTRYFDGITAVQIHDR